MVAERLRSLSPQLLRDPRAASLLLGAVLLDTVNLDPSAKAQKERERPIADELFAAAATYLECDPSLEGRHAFFDELLAVKTDTALLGAFSTRDLLRQDYKEEVVALPPADAQGAEQAPPTTLRVGVGSVTLPLPALLARESGDSLAADCAAFAAERGLDLLLLLSVDLNARQRYVLVHAASGSGAAEQSLLQLRSLVVHTLQEGGLELSPLGRPPLPATLEAHAIGALATAQHAYGKPLRTLVAHWVSGGGTLTARLATWQATMRSRARA